jgi:hypothetical protein
MNELVRDNINLAMSLRIPDLTYFLQMIKTHGKHH